MSQPYFDARALLGMGMPRHVVDSLQETYTRTGGSGTVTITLPDLDALIATALDQGRLARSLKERVDSLQAQLETIPDPTAKLTNLSAQIDELKQIILAQPKVSIKSLEHRIEQLEAQPSLARSIKELTRHLEQLEALTA